MAYSLTDLATRALRKANLIGIDETPSAADLEFASEGISSETGALAIEGIVIPNGSDQSLPTEQLEPLAQYYAVVFKADYGMITDVAAEQTKQVMRLRLRRLCVNPPTGATAHNDYF
jgi:hypothetical protein